ncbi:MAG: hypothetical protein KGK11_01010, partial [Sphingomonadales bacterium]|nr:hypothetical protein [Sphingomonadales bacterium]
IGLYFTIGRFFVASWARTRTHYLLTDRRAIIRSGLTGRREQSVALSANAETRITVFRDGFGTIEFGQSSPFYRMMPRSWAVDSSSMLAPAFERIADPQGVYRRVIQVQAGD